MSNLNNEEPRAIIIQWHGRAFGLNNQKNLIAAMAEAGVITVDHPTVIELNSEDLAKAAYLRAVIGYDSEVKLPEEIDPIIHSIEIIGTRYNGISGSQFTAKIFGDIIAEIHKKSIGMPIDLEFITAMDVLSNRTITAKYASTLKKYGVTKVMLETIHNAYNAYHVNQNEFI